jgi:hypothetical protein
MGSLIMGDLVMDGMQYPEWQRFCHDALVEFDQDKLPERVAAAEAAIARRLQAMEAGDDSLKERQAIADLLAILRTLKRESAGPSKGREEEEPT